MYHPSPGQRSVLAQSATDTPTASPTPSPIPEPTATTCGSSPLQGRTQKVVDAIVAEISGVTDCADVTAAHLAAIRFLNLNNKSLTSLQASDFAGLTSLVRLNLYTNDLTTLAADQFTGLTNLQVLFLDENELTELKASQFVGLTSLEWLYLDDNKLPTLPDGLFAGLINQEGETSLQRLYLQDNELSRLAADQFEGLDSLTHLALSDNQLGSLAANQFAGLDSLQQLFLHRSQLSCLPSALFAGLTSLQLLFLYGNGLGNVEPVYFQGSQPGALRTLYFDVPPRLEGTGQEATAEQLAEYQVELPKLTTLIMTPFDETSDPVCATATATNTPLPTATSTATGGPVVTGTPTATPHNPHAPSPTPTPLPAHCRPPGPPGPPGPPAPPVLPRVIGDSSFATAYELPGDRVQLRIHRHDWPAAARTVELGVGWLAADGTRQVFVGFVRDATAGTTYAVLRREGDGQIVRWWIAPASPLVDRLPWARVLRDYSFPPAVLAAIPLDNRHPQPHQLVRHFAGADRRIMAYDAGQRQWRSVPDAATFQARGFYWCDVTVAAEAFFRQLPQWAPYPASSMPARADYPHCRP